MKISWKVQQQLPASLVGPDGCWDLNVTTLQLVNPCKSYPKIGLVGGLFRFWNLCWVSEPPIMRTWMPWSSLSWSQRARPSESHQLSKNLAKLITVKLFVNLESGGHYLHLIIYSQTWSHSGAESWQLPEARATAGSRRGSWWDQATYGFDNLGSRLTTSSNTKHGWLCTKMWFLFIKSL